jgi:hypothetical protein
MRSALARARAYAAIFLSMRGEALAVRIAHDRHHQSALGRDRDADVVELVIDDVGAVDRGVHVGIFFSASIAAFTKKDMKPSFTPWSSRSSPCTRAQLLHRAHVHFVERGEQSLGRLRFDQALRDALPQPRHGNALLGASARLGRQELGCLRLHAQRGFGSESGGSPFRQDFALIEEADDIRLRQPAVATPSAGIARIEAFSSTSRRTEGLSLRASSALGGSTRPARQRHALARPGPLGCASRCRGTAHPRSTASSCPLVTVVPATAAIVPITPFIGAGTSSTTLSVSRSARFSSRRTASPGACARQRASHRRRIRAVAERGFQSS